MCCSLERGVQDYLINSSFYNFTSSEFSATSAHNYSNHFGITSLLNTKKVVIHDGRETQELEFRDSDLLPHLSPWSTYTQKHQPKGASALPARDNSGRSPTTHNSKVYGNVLKKKKMSVGKTRLK